MNRTGRGSIGLDRYAPSGAGGPALQEDERRRRYTQALTAPDSPIEIENVDLADLFHEPIYQLVRQQLLAHQLERDPAVHADVVRVVHVLSTDNTAYSRSYVAPGLRSLGGNPKDVWGRLLRTANRFVNIDPAVFLNPEITSPEYAARYGMARKV